jgi:ribonuclease VapC
VSEDEPRAATVLDTSAVIAYMLRARGWESVQAALQWSRMSTVNLCEVIGKFCERGEQAEQIEQDVLGLGMEVVDFSAAQALIAARLRPETRHLGLSLGDRECLALGMELGAVVLTADHSWSQLTAPHRVELIRQIEAAGL